jgi:hypothetical protein
MTIRMDVVLLTTPEFLAVKDQAVHEGMRTTLAFPEPTPTSYDFQVN